MRWSWIDQQIFFIVARFYAALRLLSLCYENNAYRWKVEKLQERADKRKQSQDLNE